MNFIEPLESRIAPALIAPGVTNGVLTIEHDPTGAQSAENIVVTQNDPDSFTVEDTLAGATFSPFDLVKSIVVKAGTLGDQIDLKFTADGLTGKLDISAAGGTNAITLTSTNGTSGFIAGKVTILGGTNKDTVEINGGLAIASQMLFDGHEGLDDFIPDGAYLAKKLTLESVENITTANALNPVVIGGMLVEDEEPDGNVSFVLSQVAMINGQLTYCGSDSHDDNVTLNGQFIGPVNLMLLGGINNVTSAGTFLKGITVSGGAGADTVIFNSVSVNIFDPTKPPFITANVAGGVAMKLGDGANTVTFDNGSFFAKDVSVTTGIGTDTVNLNKVMVLKNLKLTLGNGANEVKVPLGGKDNFIGGEFKYIGGINSDTLDLDGLIAGKITVGLGDGTNGVTGDLRLVGKSASFTGGAGADTLNFSLGSTGGTLTAKLGGGGDFLTFNGGSLASVKLDGGTDIDTLTGLANLPAKQKIVGFEFKF